jgi:hypothetical protein
MDFDDMSLNIMYVSGFLLTVIIVNFLTATNAWL